MEAIFEAKKGVDIIGDIHGYIGPVRSLLRARGYEDIDGVWRHPAGRKVLFVGDLIDRGPTNRLVIELVKNMVENHEAICLMGNHELNAVHFATEREGRPGQHLRARSNKNLWQHVDFLYEYRNGKKDLEAYHADIDWIKKLPLWIDAGAFCAVHACWSPQHMEVFDHNPLIATKDPKAFWLSSSDDAHDYYQAVETLLKGAEFDLPKGISFQDKQGIERRSARIRWWAGADSWADAVLGPLDLKRQLTGIPFESDSAHSFDVGDKPVFFGHYWMPPRNGRPWLTQHPNMACLDFSIGSPTGLLGMYQWDGEDILSPAKLIASDHNGRIFEADA